AAERRARIVRGQLRDLGQPPLEAAGAGGEHPRGLLVDDVVVLVGARGIGGDDLLGPRPQPREPHPPLGALALVRHGLLLRRLSGATAGRSGTASSLQNSSTRFLPVRLAR